jgi:hypothetical protein
MPSVTVKVTLPQDVWSRLARLSSQFSLPVSAIVRLCVVKQMENPQLFLTASVVAVDTTEPWVPYPSCPNVQNCVHSCYGNCDFKR